MLRHIGIGPFAKISRNLPLIKEFQRSIPLRNFTQSQPQPRKYEKQFHANKLSALFEMSNRGLYPRIESAHMIRDKTYRVSFEYVDTNVSPDVNNNSPEHVIFNTKLDEAGYKVDHDKITVKDSELISFDYNCKELERPLAAREITFVIISSFIFGVAIFIIIMHGYNDIFR